MKNIFLIVIVIINIGGANAQPQSKLFISVEKYGVPIVGINPNPPYEEIISGYYAPPKLAMGTYYFIEGTDTNKVAIIGQYGENGAFGVFKYLHASGDLMRIENWDDGKRNGLFIEFDSNGQIVSIRTYQNGAIYGDAYTISKDVINITHYLNGKYINTEWFKK